MPDQTPNPAKAAVAASDTPVSRCPICNRRADEKARPFCSPRCRDVDLHRWLSNSYVIPAAEGDEDSVE